MVHGRHHESGSFKLGVRRLESLTIGRRFYIFCIFRVRRKRNTGIATIQDIVMFINVSFAVPSVRANAKEIRQL